MAIVFVHGSFCPVYYFVLCASIFIHCTYSRAEHAMPKSAAGSQSSPFPCTSLLWCTSIVVASAASSPSTSTNNYESRFLCHLQTVFSTSDQFIFNWFVQLNSFSRMWSVNTNKKLQIRKEAAFTLHTKRTMHSRCNFDRT